MKKTLLITALLATAMLSATGLNAQSKETRTIVITESFDAVAVAGSHIINFQTGPAGEPLTAIGRAEDLDNVEIYVKDNTLHVRNKEQRNGNRGNRNNNNKGIQVFVKNPTLSSAMVAGSGKVLVSGGLTGGSKNFKIAGSGRVEIDKMDVQGIDISVAGSGSFRCPSVKAQSTDAKVAGSGKVEIDGVSGNLSASVAGSGKIDASNINAGSLTVVVSGSGKATFAGTANDISASVAGSGKLDASKTKVQDADVKISGSGSVSVQCSGTLTASVAGNGHVYYSGNPTSVKGSGKTKNIVKR